MVVVKRALLSCSDKTGLNTFAKALAASGVELLASGGTAEHLTRHGLRVNTVERFAGITEQLDGRVKTLHPKIYAGILARRDHPAHMNAVGKAGLIDLVVVNLYPFEQTVQRAGVSPDEAIEQIDIGGVSLLRAAAKNFAHVAAVSHPSQYAQVIEAFRSGQGTIPTALSQQLAVEALQLTSGYDAAIGRYLAAGDQDALPPAASVSLRQRQPLRYGENPHQRGAWYLPASATPWGLGTLQQLQGKELSYNNLLDMDAAFRCLLEFREPACAIIKHSSQCGLAVADSPAAAYAAAYRCDPESAFGGIVGCNRPVDAALATELTKTFLEVVMAPAVAPEALAVLGKKPNLRVVTLPWPARMPADEEWRQVTGAWLLQEPDRVTVTDDSLRVMTKRAPTEAERADLSFAWTVAKHVRSNAVVIASRQAAVGIGQGQPSRVGSVRMAVQQAGERARGAVAASDGFFPFPDGVELLAQAGVSAIIQPGGSIRDDDVIAAANRAKVAMLFTGIRHFRH